MKMKVFGLMAMAGLMSLASCDKKVGADGQPTTSDSLQVALANQDSLLVILNDITEGMNQIKQMENVLSQGGLGAETPDKRAQIREDMIQIQNALEARRQRLEQLEAQLAASNQNNATLQRAIKNLKDQIAQQESTIEDLRNQLAQANIQIEGLNQSVTRLGEEKDSLNNVVAVESNARAEAERQAVEAANELNKCYYAVGTSKELKAHKLLESGFLKKTKVMAGDFDSNYFTVGDKRNLRSINLGSKKAKVMTNQPADSYEIVDGVLKITNPAKFWNASNFLVVKTD